jgi:hypothetical protein
LARVQAHPREQTKGQEHDDRRQRRATEAEEYGNGSEGQETRRTRSICARLAVHGLGIMMLSPPVISLPVKLLLFVMVDGWALVCGGVAASFR